MASAFQDKNGWIADFRPIFSRGQSKRRRVRIPANRATSRAAAKAFAQECETYCRLLETDDVTPDQVKHALQLGAITEADAVALNVLPPPPMAKRPGELTIMEAHNLHPSTRRERERSPEEHLRHERELELFCEFSGLVYVADVRLDHAIAWLEHLKSEGKAFDTRRHKLLPLRRACRMATQSGLPDVLYGFRLDRNDQAPDVKVWTLQELGAGASNLEDAGNLRALVALALGGFLGLRPTEICRALVGDVQGDLLHVGRRQRKNVASCRALPLPATVQGWIERLAKDRPTERPLIAPDKRITNKPDTIYNRNDFAHWIVPVIGEATGRSLPPKSLRKSFATWAVRAGLSVEAVEYYLGHMTGSVSIITARHYLAARRIEEMRPVAEEMDRLIRESVYKKSSTQKRR